MSDMSGSPGSLPVWVAARPYDRAMEVSYHWRGTFSNAEVNALHAAGFGHPLRERDWKAQLDRHSLGWVCARAGNRLVGFVNVPWDGGAHAFILDTLVATRDRRSGIGTGSSRLPPRRLGPPAASGCMPISTPH
jgi:acetyltransferase (GNAT) family protein